MSDLRRGREIHARDVAPAERHTLTARAKGVSRVARGHRVRPICQARERVTARAVRGGARTARAAERDRRPTPARRWTDRPGNAVGAIRRRCRLKILSAN